MEVIAVSFGADESSKLNETEYLVGWCKQRGYTLDLDKDHLHDSEYEVTCSVLGPYTHYHAGGPYPSQEYSLVACTNRPNTPFR
jgi:hypothetical protein